MILNKKEVDKGSKPGTLPFTSYPEWAKICGGIMEAAGYINPCIASKNYSQFRGDTDTQNMKLLFETCYELYPDTWIDRKTIINTAKQNGIFGFLDFEKPGHVIKFGNILKNHFRMNFSNIMLSVTDINARADRQKLCFSKKNGEKKEEKEEIKEKVIGKVSNLSNLSKSDPSALKKDINYIGSSQTMTSTPSRTNLNMTDEERMNYADEYDKEVKNNVE